MSGIDSDTLEELALKFMLVSKREHWLIAYLAHLAPTRSRFVLDVLADQIFSYHLYREYQAMPFGAHELRPLVQAIAEPPIFAVDLRDTTQKRALADNATLPHFTDFLGHVATEIPDLVRNMINMELDSVNKQLHRASLYWVRALPHEIVEHNVPLVVSLLEHAHAIGPDIGQRVQGAVFAEIISGAESGAHYKGAPSDMRANRFLSKHSRVTIFLFRSADSSSIWQSNAVARREIRLIGRKRYSATVVLPLR